MTDYQAQCETTLLAGQWDQALPATLAWARHSATSTDSDPRPYFALNVIYLLRGEFADAWNTHPKCLQELDDIAQVKEWVEAFVAGHLEQANAHLVMGLFLAQSGQSEQSITSYKEAIKLGPQSAYPHYFLAQIHERANHLEMAIKEYREAVQLDPTYVPAHTNLGVAYQEQGRLEMAIPQYRKVIKLHPADAIAHANLACALAEQGKFEPALQSYKEALRLNPKDAAVHFALGDFYDTRGRLDLAQKEYEAALVADPNFGPAHAAIGWMELGRQHMQAAYEAFNRALKANDEDPRAYHGIAEYYSQKASARVHWTISPRRSNSTKTPKRKMPSSISCFKKDKWRTRVHHF
ncbi:UDP-N-acetylglucosamine--peptide N-acetylglucosaminyltransferase [Nitrospirota bacterium]|nr:UDP-N-acetylglucosamine--peptide N-acetylglucosaminyltransferase [Nitrospirota bacterium]